MIRRKTLVMDEMIFTRDILPAQIMNASGIEKIRVRKNTLRVTPVYSTMTLSKRPILILAKYSNMKKIIKGIYKSFNFKKIKGNLPKTNSGNSL